MSPELQWKTVIDGTQVHENGFEYDYFQISSISDQNVHVGRG